MSGGTAVLPSSAMACALATLNGLRPMERAQTRMAGSNPVMAIDSATLALVLRAGVSNDSNPAALVVRRGQVPLMSIASAASPSNDGVVLSGGASATGATLTLATGDGTSQPVVERLRVGPAGVAALGPLQVAGSTSVADVSAAVF